MKKTPYMRKKEPDRVKRRLLDAAAVIAVERGVAAITLDGVARAAGVSKGGLLHHFPARPALVEALYADLLARVESTINALVEQDPNPEGRFTRAYITAVTGGDSEGKLLGTCALGMTTEPGLAVAWTMWLARNYARHDEEENSVTGRIARYAADGIWLDDAVGASTMGAEERAVVIEKLIAMTRTI